ncbi:hypothetical protein POTOM_017232 [Populus tomentosa]|uniref:valine--tRNA ligase n=1 Tax=Populus tomentosa TaxID=118781 RepID=A0A8X8CVI6_POPTO|nr:hypothetical protein POTOM_017232 [Populus tomentosa]
MRVLEDHVKHIEAFPVSATENGVFTSPEIARSFDFSSEERMHNWWESQGFFKPSFDRGSDPFVVSMPPPNVTGSLHMGHAMFVTLEDIMVRYNRMKGRPTLWLPGTDHAGFKSFGDLPAFWLHNKMNVFPVVGHDILFFWVARMIMMGIEFTGTVPFSYVYLHGHIQDSQLSLHAMFSLLSPNPMSYFQGRKMSKTLGNVIDPLDTIKEFGTDALRFTISLGTAGQNLPSQTDVSAWDAIWIISLTKRSLFPGYLYQNVGWCQNFMCLLTWSQLAMTSFSLEMLGEKLIWSDFADCKACLYQSGADSTSSVAQAVLLYVFENVLKVLHPFMPFVTEELWQALPERKEALILSPWPQTSLPQLPNSKKKIENFQDLTRAIHNARAEYSVEPAKRISASIVASEEVIQYISVSALHFLNLYCRCLGDANQSVHLVASEGLEAYLPLADMVDISAEVKPFKAPLQDASRFVEKAPKDVVHGVREKAAEAE